MELEQNNIRRILVRSTNWVGDALLTTPALASLRENFPDSHISVLAKKWVAAVFENHPAVNDVIIYDIEGRHKGWSGFLSLAREIRAKRFDLAVLFQHAFGAALLVWLARIPERVGYNTDARGFLLNRAVRYRPEDKEIHETDSYQGLISRSGLKVRLSNPVFYLPPEVEQWALNKLTEWNLDDTFILGLAPGAAYGPAKQWPQENFAKAARIILEKIPGAVFIFGSQSEAGVARGVKELLNVPAYDLTGSTNLAEAAALIKRCRLFLTNDSGLMHVGAAVGTPLVAIFGSTNPITTSPYTKKARVIRHAVDCAPCLKRECMQPRHLCMELVTPEEVAAAGLELLKQAGEPDDEP